MSPMKEIPIKAFVGGLQIPTDLLIRDASQINCERRIDFKPIWKNIQSTTQVLLGKPNPDFLNTYYQIEGRLLKKGLYERIWAQIKMNKLILFISLLLALAIRSYAQQSDFPILTGPYLGQRPPGLMPEVFAPGVVSREGHQTKLFFSSDCTEAIYNETDPVNNRNHFIWMRCIRGVWSEPVIIPFSTEYINNEPCLSPDGNMLFFVSNRPALPGGEAEKTPDIWMSERIEDGWGEPLRLGPAVNAPEVEVQPSFSSDGKLYFMRQSGGRRQLLCSSFQDGQFLEPISIGGNLSPDQVSGPCISPDNRVLILHSKMEGGFGNWDLYASFRDASGNWGKLINLGNKINTKESEGNATFSHDGKYLFFTRNADIFWVSSRVIEELIPKE